MDDLVYNSPTAAFLAAAALAKLKVGRTLGARLAEPNVPGFSGPLPLAPPLPLPSSGTPESYVPFWESSTRNNPPEGLNLVLFGIRATIDRFVREMYEDVSADSFHPREAFHELPNPEILPLEDPFNAFHDLLALCQAECSQSVRPHVTRNRLVCPTQAFILAASIFHPSPSSQPSESTFWTHLMGALKPFYVRVMPFKDADPANPVEQDEYARSVFRNFTHHFWFLVFVPFDENQKNMTVVIGVGRRLEEIPLLSKFLNRSALKFPAPQLLKAYLHTSLGCVLVHLFLPPGSTSESFDLCESMKLAIKFATDSTSTFDLATPPSDLPGTGGTVVPFCSPMMRAATEERAKESVSGGDHALLEDLLTATEQEMAIGQLLRAVYLVAGSMSDTIWIGLAGGAIDPGILEKEEVMELRRVGFDASLRYVQRFSVLRPKTFNEVVESHIIWMRQAAKREQAEAGFDQMWASSKTALTPEEQSTSTRTTWPELLSSISSDTEVPPLPLSDDELDPQVYSEDNALSGLIENLRL
ncbi:hypothetical protein NMY22_g8528 [Coprinellus aureogranulatus]|nr:hypothetical protein NMY22_g8528 [Coprinellus aureogranulatus]